MRERGIATVLLIAAVCVLFAADAAAQVVYPCPKISIVVPDAVDGDGNARFSAEVQAGDPNVTPTFNWTISDAVIEKGQGTDTIFVAAKYATGRTISLTVDVGGFAPDCVRSVKQSFTLPEKRVARKFDEFGDLDREAIWQRLTPLAKTLWEEERDSRAHVIIYGGRYSTAGDVRRLTEWTTGAFRWTALVDSRLTSEQGGYREEPTVELWIVPPGADAPFATPTLDPSEVTPRPPKVSRRVDALLAFDMYEIVTKRLDILADELNDPPGSTAYLFASYSDKVSREKVETFAATVKRRLTVYGKLPVQRIVIVPVPEKAEVANIDIWLVPAGAKPPTIKKSPAERPQPAKPAPRGKPARKRS